MYKKIIHIYTIYKIPTSKQKTYTTESEGLEKNIPNGQEKKSWGGNAYIRQKRLKNKDHKKRHRMILHNTHGKNSPGRWMWLSGLSAGLCTKGLLVRYQVKANAWVAGQFLNMGCMTGNHTLMFLSLPFSLLSPLLKINEIFFKK